jgi:hypothetical protein
LLAHRSAIVKRRRRAALLNAWQSRIVDQVCALSTLDDMNLRRWRTADRRQVWGRLRIRQITLDHEDAVATLAINSGGRSCYSCRYRPHPPPSPSPLPPSPLTLTLTLTLCRLKRGELLNYDKAQQPALGRKDNDRILFQAWAVATAAYEAAPRSGDRSRLKEAVKRAHDSLEAAGLAKLCVRGARPLPWWRLEEKNLFSIYQQLGKCALAHPAHSPHSHLAAAHLAPGGGTPPPPPPHTTYPLPTAQRGVAQREDRP